MPSTHARTPLSQAQGLFPIAPTPFLPGGQIDGPSIDRLAGHYLRIGAAGVTVLGIMGEAPKLTPAEATAVACRFIDAMQGAPVIVGVSAPGFAAMHALTQEVMAAGAAGVMIAPTPALRTDEEIAGYFAAAAAAIGPGVPWVLQDYPLTLGVVIAPRTIRTIVQANPGCAMLNHEDWPGLDKISTLRAWQADGSMRPISILTGNGGLFLDFELERGADGAMTGYAFPEMLAETVDLHRAGEREAAHDVFDAHLPLLRYEQQARIGLAVRKYVLMRRGLITSDAQRAPWPQLSPASRAEVDYLLERLARRDALAIV